LKRSFEKKEEKVLTILQGREKGRKRFMRGK